VPFKLTVRRSNPFAESLLNLLYPSAKSGIAEFLQALLSRLLRMARTFLSAEDQFTLVTKLIPRLASIATRLNLVTRQHAYMGKLGRLCTTIQALLQIWEDYMRCNIYDDRLQLHTEDHQFCSSSLLTAFLDIEGEQIIPTHSGRGRDM
jgi:hypothetical protein